MKLRPSSSSQHYYARQPVAASQPREMPISVRGRQLRLLVDRGVFSARGLDRGTKLLAETMELPPRAEILDWGAGYGVLGLLAAQMCPAGTVVLVEINERAAALAQQNAHRLGLPNVQVIVGEAPQALGGRDFDVIVSNPPLRAGKEAVLAIVEYAAKHLRPGGELWLVIPTNKGAKRYFRYLQERFGQAATKAISGGYRVLWAKQASGDVNT